MAESEDVLPPESPNGDGHDFTESDIALAELRGDLDAALRRIDDLETEVEHLRDEIERGDTTTPDDLTVLETYSAMPPEDRDDLISGSQKRAVAIFNSWWDMAEKTPKGWVISTRRNSKKKHNPSQVKLDLESVTGESLEWMQVYRAMQEVARLSGGEEHTDDYGRLHIHSGAFEYHERPTPDGEYLYKHVVLADPNSLTLL